MIRKEVVSEIACLTTTSLKLVKTGKILGSLRRTVSLLNRRQQHSRRMEFVDNTEGGVISYCTDVEGNYDYWERFLELSKVLKRDEATSKVVFTNPKAQFVFGGDVCDRGPGDLRLLNDLVQLYEDNTGRVHFILGNRDVNKMRIPVELHVKYLEAPGKCYWIPADPEQKPQSAADRLKWILAKTMGSPGGFNYRKDELAIMKRPNDDEDVVESFFDLLVPEGTLMKYMKYGKISVAIGDTLFCHGGINGNNMGWVPPKAPNSKNTPPGVPGALGGTVVEDLREWLDALNDHVNTEVTDFIDNAPKYLRSLGTIKNAAEVPEHWAAMGTYDHDQPGSRLGFLGMAITGDKVSNPSVIYASYMDKGMPVTVDEEVCSKILASGFKRLIVGHQPHGDAPTPIEQNGLQILMGDTSYSANTLWTFTTPDAKEETWAKAGEEMLTDPALGLKNVPLSKDNSRGITVSEILVAFPDAECKSDSRAFMHGVLSDGSTYAFELPAAADNKYLGKMNASKTWMVKASNVTVKHGPLAGQTDAYLMSRGEGFNFKNKFIPAADMETEMET